MFQKCDKILYCMSSVFRGTSFILTEQLHYNRKLN